MGYKSTIQIVLVIVSIVIIVAYVKPTFEEMKTTQVETAVYQEALDNALVYSDELQKLSAEVKKFSASELRTLKRYIPDEIDAVSVMRDIEAIVRRNQMVTELLEASDFGLREAGSMQSAQGQTDPDQEKISAGLSFGQFTLVTSGSYEQFKFLLQDFEKNAYPLEITSISFTPSVDSLYTFSVVLETYSFTGNAPTE
jgi:hypothetical protein